MSDEIADSPLAGDTPAPAKGPTEPWRRSDGTLPPPLPASMRTARLVIRRWTPADAPLLKAAIDANLEHLRAWMPWAHAEPSAVEVIAERLTRVEADHASGRDWTVAIFDRDDRELVGGAGLHARRAPGTLEIGYWVAAEAEGKGYVTEAVEALTSAAFDMLGADRVEIRCDERNVRSSAVARRAGYRLEQSIEGDPVGLAGAVRTTMVWAISAKDWRGTSSEHA
jgi:RimJ/RimL family protein N-acetyltransferase